MHLELRRIRWKALDASIWETDQGYHIHLAQWSPKIMAASQSSLME